MADHHKKMNENTKQRIETEFIKLLESEGFERISVKQIAVCASINRGTFYLHYIDKYDVMEHIQKRLLEGLSGLVEQVRPSEVLHVLMSGNFYSPFLMVFEYIKNHGNEFRALLGDRGDPSFARKMKEIFGDILLNKIIQHYPGTNKWFPQYMTAFMTSSILGLIQEWLEHLEEQSVEEMARTHLEVIGFISNLKTMLKEGE
ncbi:TetR/AcrR family transcriptional regulator C-terminal domain-containing protein [Virgibacillus halodenitrificans]|uniref:TetR/AcrR family transcriptional regulator n=1 Tax=Virgibacillus halodenitrificans TaxID=1482 RepID=UPI001FB293C4|nr:TetR/AcrR family transcriptional regulator C-terminal domain-containing protein [Virgibacillus halodenitrificans]MCJ0930642.1 TetR/AcrR family transcriptional regulator C-terminal domain-containing protein [Virgibacillus halodenitrificans]